MNIRRDRNPIGKLPMIMLKSGYQLCFARAEKLPLLSHIEELEAGLPTADQVIMHCVLLNSTTEELR
jgi:hypothetical protein